MSPLVDLSVLELVRVISKKFANVDHLKCRGC